MSWFDIGNSLIGGLATGVQMIGQKAREKRAMENQQKLMGIQLGNQQTLNAEQFARQQELNRMGHELQMEAWRKTNYPAQLSMLKEAGLNPALLYGQGGAGGSTTGSQGGGSAQGGSAQGGNAPAPQPMDLGNMLLGAQMQLLKAQARKTEEEANVIETTGVKEAETRISKMIAETQNEYAKKGLTEIQADLTRIDTANRQYIIDAEVNNILEKTRELKLQNYITEEGTESILKDLEQTALLKTVQVASENAKIKLTETQVNEITNSIQQKWEQVAQGWEQLDKKQQEIEITKQVETLKAEYPSLLNVSGGFAKELVRGAQNVFRALSGFKREDYVMKDTIK